MAIAKLDKPQVMGALKATGSSDADVLYARKEELLADTKKMKMLGTVPIVLGIVMSITIVGAVVGIPMILFGVWMRKRIKGNLEVADAAYNEYVQNVKARASAA